MRRATPCWLASPEVVAEIFPLQKNLFDLVIFDEASQLAVERSLPVLYRAKHVVIAGDEQQMPPSNFFGASNDDDDEDGEFEVPEALKQESLLVLAKRIYGFCYLGWHYRSEHKELIDFSNFAFYDGTLNIAANVGRATQSPPIKWVPVQGTWQSNTNLVEAKKAVDILHDTLGAPEHGRARSVGIITFNATQMDAIKDEIERRRAVDADFASLMLTAETRPAIDERPFVKNIENVQGDERDVIIFSVGYGPDANGTFRRSFGPIGLSGGENRLNVAVTRAKRSAHVICSFDPELLVAGTSKNIGPVRFRQYLQYAKAIAEGNRAAVDKVLLDVNPSVAVGAVARTLAFESSFEEAVFNALVLAGYEVETQVGLAGYRIDLAVVDPREPSRFCLGIECDGANFHSGKSVRERDIARQRFLESRGWNVARVWSRNWWLDPHREIRRLLALLPAIPLKTVDHREPLPASASNPLKRPERHTLVPAGEDDDTWLPTEPIKLTPADAPDLSDATTVAVLDAKPVVTHQHDDRSIEQREAELESQIDAAVRAAAPRTPGGKKAAVEAVAVAEQSAPVAVTSAPLAAGLRPGDWLQTLPDGGVRQIFEHLVAHGAVTETEAGAMLSGPRELRRFARDLELHAALAPFRVRIDMVGGVKRYVREGGDA